jgi:hypothetical protein
MNNRFGRDDRFRSDDDWRNDDRDDDRFRGREESGWRGREGQGESGWRGREGQGESSWRGQGQGQSRGESFYGGSGRFGEDDEQRGFGSTQRGYGIAGYGGSSRRNREYGSGSHDETSGSGDWRQQGYGEQGRSGSSFGSGGRASIGMGQRIGGGFSEISSGSYGRSGGGGRSMGDEGSYGSGGYGSGSYGSSGYGSGSYGSSGYGSSNYGGSSYDRERGFGGGEYGQYRSYAGRGPKGYTRSDDRIKEEVCDRLSMNDEVDASDIEVKVQGGEVTLEGSVENRRMKHMAEDIAESVSGVQDVHNHVRVRKGLLSEIGDKITGKEDDKHYANTGTKTTSGTAGSSTSSTASTGSTTTSPSPNNRV